MFDNWIFENSKNGYAALATNLWQHYFQYLSEELKERVKKQIPNDPSKTMGLYSVCSLLKEAKYDLTTNVSVVDGITNGAEFIIKKIDYLVEGSSRPSIVWVLSQEQRIGNDYRKEYYSYLYNESIDKNVLQFLR